MSVGVLPDVRFVRIVTAVTASFGTFLYSCPDARPPTGATLALRPTARGFFFARDRLQQGDDRQGPRQGSIEVIKRRRWGAFGPPIPFLLCDLAVCD
jgi:hypothetical protein